MNNKKTSKVAPETKFCAHCLNLGMPEAKYRSHYIRATADPNSAVVCPELLATECKYCFKTGHTVTKCPILASQKKNEKKVKYQEEVAKKHQEEAKKTPNKKPLATTRFAALDSDSEDEEQTPKQKVTTTKVVTTNTKDKKSDFMDNFPALTTKKTVVIPQQPARSFAEMAAKSKSEYEDEQFLKAKMTKRVEMPTLSRGQTFRQQAQEPIDEFWAEMDPEEDEMEYAVKQIEAKTQVKKTLKASELDWAMLDSDSSDDEDW
jgi:hypothetical protein